jgi:hypothetical protein
VRVNHSRCLKVSRTRPGKQQVVVALSVPAHPPKQNDAFRRGGIDLNPAAKLQ